MTTRHDHHGFTDADARSFDKLRAEAQLVEGTRNKWRFPSIAAADTFGSWISKAADEYDATYLAVCALNEGAAFWKR